MKRGGFIGCNYADGEETSAANADRTDDAKELSYQKSLAN